MTGARNHSNGFARIDLTSARHDSREQLCAHAQYLSAEQLVITATEPAQGDLIVTFPNPGISVPVIRSLGGTAVDAISSGPSWCWGGAEGFWCGRRALGWLDIDFAGLVRIAGTAGACGRTGIVRRGALRGGRFGSVGRLAGFFVVMLLATRIGRAHLDEEMIRHAVRGRDVDIQ